MYLGSGFVKCCSFNISLLSSDSTPVKFGSTTSDSIKAMITDDTTHILMNIIAFEEDENLENYLEYSKKLLEKFADATIIDSKITIAK